MENGFRNQKCPLKKFIYFFFFLNQIYKKTCIPQLPLAECPAKNTFFLRASLPKGKNIYSFSPDVIDQHVIYIIIIKELPPPISVSVDTGINGITTKFAVRSPIFIIYTIVDWCISKFDYNFITAMHDVQILRCVCHRTLN